MGNESLDDLREQVINRGFGKGDKDRLEDLRFWNRKKLEKWLRNNPGTVTPQPREPTNLRTKTPSPPTAPEKEEVKIPLPDKAMHHIVTWIGPERMIRHTAIQELPLIEFFRNNPVDLEDYIKNSGMVKDRKKIKEYAYLLAEKYEKKAKQPQSCWRYKRSLVGITTAKEERTAWDEIADILKGEPDEVMKHVRLLIDGKKEIPEGIDAVSYMTRMYCMEADGPHNRPALLQFLWNKMREVQGLGPDKDAYFGVVDTEGSEE